MTQELKAAVSWLFAATGVVVLVAAVAMGLYVNVQLSRQTNDERERNTRLACLEQNARNERTKEKVRSLEFPAEGQTTTFLLIDALAPLRDCDALTASRVSN